MNKKSEINQKSCSAITNSGLLLIDKPAGVTTFSLVAKARKRFGIQKVGHGGTLDPFATGLVILLLGREYTKRASEFLEGDKAYTATLFLGKATDSYDIDGKVTFESEVEPTIEQVEAVLQKYQGIVEQVPPMFSAKKVKGKKLYELARKGIEIERKPVQVRMEVTKLSYTYPKLEISVTCSKGTYIRSLADDIGKDLGSYAHLVGLRRTRSGSFHIDDAHDANFLEICS